MCVFFFLNALVPYILAEGWLQNWLVRGPVHHYATLCAAHGKRDITRTMRFAVMRRIRACTPADKPDKQSFRYSCQRPFFFSCIPYVQLAPCMRNMRKCNKILWTQSIVSSHRKGNENLPWLTERTRRGHAFIAMLSIVPVY